MKSGEETKRFEAEQRARVERRKENQDKPDQGHVWVVDRPNYPPFCRICGVMRRGDGKPNKGCGGPVRVVLRGDEEFASRQGICGVCEEPRATCKCQRTEIGE